MNPEVTTRKTSTAGNISSLSPRRLIAAGLLRVRPASAASFLKRVMLFKRQELITDEGVFYVDLASNLGYRLATTGVYEPDMLKVVKGHLKSGSVFVDLGANEGYFSVVASKIVGSLGRIVAVEPQERLQSVLKRNLSLNNCSNVQVVAMAINENATSITLHLSPDMNTGSTAAVQTTRYKLLQQKVEGITLEALFAQQKIDTCDLLKVDIEGHEYEAILGSRALFSDGRVKAIALELHPQVLAQRNLSPNAVTDFLISCGYRRDPSFANTVFVDSKLL